MLDIHHLSLAFRIKNHVLTVVDDISFSVPDNKIVGLVGESGSGKTVSALSILGLLPTSGFIQNGHITWRGKVISTYSESQYQTIRGREIGFIFQNPLTALNPVFSIGDHFVETLRVHFKLSKKEATEQAIHWLTRVNIPDADKRIKDYPHQFSLGMCQRIMIALTLAMKPKLLIADEPTASLDVTIQIQILELLHELKNELDMSILIISHDLGVIAQHCDDVLVMYLGKLVEKGPAERLFANPYHPYTQALINAIPLPDPQKKVTHGLVGEVPSLYSVSKTKCRFHTRCPKLFDACTQSCPTLIAKERSEVACFLYT